MNKAELIDALSARLGDKRAATQALDAVLAEIQTAVTKGDKVAITGFGVFEKKVRAARTARNPRTGEAVKVKKTSVPAFRPGAGFRELVASGKVPKVAAAKKTVSKSAATKAGAKTTAAKATSTRAAYRSLRGHHGAAGMYMTLPQPRWPVTGATLWIMSQCHQTESPARTSGMPARACMRARCADSRRGSRETTRRHNSTAAASSLRSIACAASVSSAPR